MKIFIGQAVTGEDEKKLKTESLKIIEALNNNGHEAYATIINEEMQEKGIREIFNHAFEEIDKSDAFLAIIRNEKRSEGMLIEVGYVLSKKKKFFVAINKNVRDKTYIDELADKVIEFENLEELNEKLGEIK